MVTSFNRIIREPTPKLKPKPKAKPTPKPTPKAVPTLKIHCRLRRVKAWGPNSGRREATASDLHTYFEMYGHQRHLVVFYENINTDKELTKLNMHQQTNNDRMAPVQSGADSKAPVRNASVPVRSVPVRSACVTLTATNKTEFASQLLTNRLLILSKETSLKPG
jgi:hypothetical protein